MKPGLRSLLAGAVASVLALVATNSASATSPLEKVALDYALTFEPVLLADPTEADHLGVTADELRRLEPGHARRLSVISSEFRADETGAANLQDALLASNLWWVTLELEGNPRLVVTVQLPSDTNGWRAVGLNWVNASVLEDAVDVLGDPDASIVYVPDHASIAIGTIDGVVSAMPIVDVNLRDRMHLPDHPVPASEYSAMVRGQLHRGSDGQVGEAGGTAAGEAPLEGGAKTTVALAVILIPLTVFGLTAVRTETSRRDECGHRIPRGRQR